MREIESKVMAFLLFFKQIASQRDAPRGFIRPFEKGYLVIFLLSTVCHFHDDGIRGRKDLGSGEGDIWQIAASAVIHQSWINRRPWRYFSPFLSLFLSFSLFHSLLFSSLYISSFSLLFANSCSLRIACVATADGVFLLSQDFPFLFR